MSAPSQFGPPMPVPPSLPMGVPLGRSPTVKVDVPICAVFLFLFACGAIGHMTLFRLNMRRGHKFIPSAATFGFCMARISACSLRIAWACHPFSMGVAIAAQIFVAAGVLLLLILNTIYAQRLLRAYHPQVGWSRGLSIFFKILYVLVVLTLVMVIVAVVQIFNTSNPNTRRIDRDLQLYGQSYFLFFATMPLWIIAYTLLAPRKPGQKIDHFGKGSYTPRFLIVGITQLLLLAGAAWRAGSNYASPQPVTRPPWYTHKAAFYVMNFGVEIICVYIYLFGRIDQRFYVPDGSSKVRHYSSEPAKEPSEDKGLVGNNA
ncbi:hypothetical protein VTN49DRAFT_1063 [Thermomyces lanuginosus]|uniref:uncharacterized protein n=1 Tax=Thermomyces lanuginosus TaxID=5541 RepID=UPI003744052B